MRSHRTSVISSKSVMLRKFRRLRVTVIFYVCCSLGILFLLININDYIKRFIQERKQIPISSLSYSSSPHEHDHNQIHDFVESSLVSSRDVHLSSMGDFGAGGLSGILHDSTLNNKAETEEDSNLSKVRRELYNNMRFSSKSHPGLGFFVTNGNSFILPIPNEKPWFMAGGVKYPSLATNVVGRNLWYEECREDRILNQLMYVTEDSINQLPNLTSSSSSIASNLYEYSVGLIGSVASAVAGGSTNERKYNNNYTNSKKQQTTNFIHENTQRNLNTNHIVNNNNANEELVPFGVSNTDGDSYTGVISERTKIILSSSSNSYNANHTILEISAAGGGGDNNNNNYNNHSSIDFSSSSGNNNRETSQTLNRVPSNSGSASHVNSNIYNNNSINISKANRMNKNPLKTILLYYGLGMSWGSQIVAGRQVFLQQKCPVNACRLTGTRSHLNKADVVVFKDVFMNPKVKRLPHQLWTIYMLECPLNTQNFIEKDVFNLTATYRHDSDIVTPYEKWVYYNDNVHALPQDVNYAVGKTKKVAWFVSNCVAKNNRLEYARELGKYIDVDIYGACGTHACSRANAKQCFELLSKTYKFYLAFENSNCRDYISEKFFVNGLGNNVLPIVMGAHPDDYKRVAPIKSYIHVDDFASPKELAEVLHKLDQDDDAYNEYFKWKGTGEFINTHFFCRLCAMAHYVDRSDHKPRYYEDFNKWWRGPRVCIRRSWRNQPDIFSPDYKDKQSTNHQPKRPLF